MPTDEQRARKREYMRRYREGRNRSAEGRLYWQKNREQILAKRKAKIATDEEREKKRAYDRAYFQANRAKFYDAAKKAYPKHKRKKQIRAVQRQRALRELKAGRPKPDRCEVCDEGGRIAFDHCHRSGEFRGWLCQACNQALGLVKDDPERLRKLITYLERTIP
jgi:hypothetical protein